MLDTWSVKMEDVDKADLQKIIEKSGLNKKEFMENLMRLYKMQKVEEKTPEVAMQIAIMKDCTTKIFNTFLGLADNIEAIKTCNAEKHFVELQQKEDKILSLQQQLSGKEGEFEAIGEAFNTAVAQKNELLEQIKQLEETINAQKSNIILLEESKDTLTQIVTEYKQYKEDYQTLQNRLENTRKQRDDLEVISQGKDAKISSLEALIDNNNIQHNLEKEQLRKTMEIENKEKMLELQQKHQQDIETINQNHNKQIAELQAIISSDSARHNQKIEELQLIISEDNKRYKELLERLEQQKNQPKKNNNKKEETNNTDKEIHKKK